MQQPDQQTPGTSAVAAHRLIRTCAPGARISEADLAALGGSLPAPLTASIDSHRRLRGPYTAAGTLMRAIVPDALQRCPDLAAAHGVEILTVAPELRSIVPATHQTLTSLAVPAERTRFYSRMRTLRLAHGMTEFIRDYVRSGGRGPVSLVVDRLDQADPTDQELISVLVRRLDPALVTLVVGVGEELDPDLPLAAALRRHTRLHESSRAGQPGESVAGPGEDAYHLARRYVAGECTDVGADAEPLRAAYEGLDAAQRAKLHDERAEQLAALGEKSLELGAIPFHREHGSDVDRAAAALRTGLDYCIDMGFYEATVDFGRRGRALIDWRAQLEHWWAFTTKMTTSLAALNRPEEAEALYDEARAFTDDPLVHMQAAYATAMLYTRHHDESRKDHQTALGWINAAIALSGLLPDEKDRAFNTVFHRNGKALIENHLRRPEEALALVSEGLDLLERELDADAHRLHRSVLRYNRAQVFAAIGKLDEAVADFTAVIDEDPNYAEYHFDLGGLLHRLGRDEEAIAEYETAMRLSPPFPELYYNRGDVRAGLGDLDGAAADFRYVLELDPEYTDAYVNLAGLLADLGGSGTAETASADAAAVVAEGLTVAPDNPHLLCLNGRLHLESGRLSEARSTLNRALAADPALAEAWALLGMVCYTEGDRTEAVAALSRALELNPTSAAYFNRGAMHEEAEEWEPAIADFTAAIDGDPQDSDSWAHRSACRARLGQADAAAADLRRAQELEG
jgi:tetratricopeptide (TPR) repeat protein